MKIHFKAHIPILLGCLVLGLRFPLEATGDDGIVAKLRSLGAEFERDDDDNVTAVDFGFEQLATDSDLALLKALNHLVVVNMSGLQFTDVGLKHIAALSSLKRLNLSDTKFTNADLNYLEGLTALEDLDLSGTAITDAAIPSLATLRQLKWINLSFTRVTPEGLRLLRSKSPNVHVRESWNYSASMIGGRGVLNTDRATIVFNEIRGGSNRLGGGGGSSILVSKPQKDDVELSSGGGGFSIGLGGGSGITASASREKGIPTIRIGRHCIEIKSEGTEVVVNGQLFRLGSTKIRIIVDNDGVARLEK